MECSVTVMYIVLINVLQRSSLVIAIKQTQEDINNIRNMAITAVGYTHTRT